MTLKLTNGYVYDVCFSQFSGNTESWVATLLNLRMTWWRPFYEPDKHVLCGGGAILQGLRRFNWGVKSAEWAKKPKSCSFFTKFTLLLYFVNTYWFLWSHNCHTGKGKIGTGAFAPTLIWQWMQCTHPQKKTFL